MLIWERNIPQISPEKGIPPFPLIFFLILATCMAAIHDAFHRMSSILFFIILIFTNNINEK